MAVQPVIRFLLGKFIYLCNLSRNLKLPLKFFFCSVKEVKSYNVNILFLKKGKIQIILDHLGFISDFGLFLFLVFNSFYLNKFAFGYIGIFFFLLQ